MEVGAFNGFNWSNTYPLINLGWSGLLFEPVEEFAQMCRERYAGNPRIVVEQCALADECGQAKLFAGGSMTTIAEELIDVWNQDALLRLQGLNHDNYVMCDVHTLDCRLVEHAFPYTFDLLSIDTEGSDYRVLKGLDLNRWHPRMVIVELDVASQVQIVSERVAWVKRHLGEHGYDIIHSDAINTIFWRDHDN
jgi:FkbM family methyltransferase